MMYIEKVQASQKNDGWRVQVTISGIAPEGGPDLPSYVRAAKLAGWRLALKSEDGGAMPPTVALALKGEDIMTATTRQDLMPPAQGMNESPEAYNERILDWRGRVLLVIATMTRMMLERRGIDAEWFGAEPEPLVPFAARD